MKTEVLLYMPRKLRSCPAGLVFHLCNRAARQIALFQNPFEYHQVLEVLREALNKFPVSLYAYCIMPNHWHLLVRAQRTNAISRFMHWFGTTHAARWRKFHEAVGRGAVYQNRFRSHPVEGPLAFLKTAAYIERNALAAGLVSEASVWPWGSAHLGRDVPLAPWPHPRPSRWKQLLAHPLDKETLRQIHYAEISSLPFQAPPAESLESERKLRLVV